MSSFSGLYEWESEMTPEPPVPEEPEAVYPWWISPWFIPWMLYRPGGSVALARMPAMGRARSTATFTREELRLDVDGHYPQMVVSGTAMDGLSARVHWIADLAASGTNRWIGSIWYKDGETSLWPYTQVDIRAETGDSPSQPLITASFGGEASVGRQARYRFISPSFRSVEFEFDNVEGIGRVTQIDTRAHPNRPTHLPGEDLSIDEAYRRAGFEVRKSGGDHPIPLSGTGANQTWSNMEMHDAMQIYWSRFADRAQWSMWVLFAGLHDDGTNLGGIMFDDIGPNHRQGTAIFNNSFIAQPPTDDPEPDAWVARMRFWTAVHEMGHAFNLAHSWEKKLPWYLEWYYGKSWIALQNEPEARSFMNYPFRVEGGQSAFFSDFEFRFSDAELLFMRHGPERFVQMGSADWFDNHGFRQATVSTEPRFRLELRVRPEKTVFEFLEPVVLEIKLKNISNEPQVLTEDVLKAGEHATVILKRRNSPARRWIPYARYCRQSPQLVLPAGDSAYESLFVSAGLNGWDVAEPGTYDVQMALRIDQEDIVSNTLRFRILLPVQREEEIVAQDYFSDDVGRVLTFDGSRSLEGANAVLHRIAEEFSNRKAAFHARVAIGNPLRIGYKVLSLKKGVRSMTSVADVGGLFSLAEPEVEQARRVLETALTEKPAEAVETLGHVDYRYYVELFADWLAAEGDRSAATKCQAGLHKTLSASNAGGHLVSSGVLAEIAKRFK